MKKSIYILGLLALGACTLPDVKKFNPPTLLDGPAFNVTPTGDNQGMANGKTGYNGVTIGTSYLAYGTSTDFDIAVVDCPGKVSDVTSSISVPEYGTVTVDATSLAALKGQTTGTTKVTVVTEADPDGQGQDRSCNLVFNVSDSQSDIESNGNPKTATITWPTVLVKCVGTGISAGTYQLTSVTSGNLDGGTAYTQADLETWNGGTVYVTITSPRPGLYAFSDITASLFPNYYGRAAGAVSGDLCSTTVTGHTGLLTVGVRLYTVNGTLNNDGTVTISWSYVRPAGGTPATPATGTYTLTKI